MRLFSKPPKWLRLLLPTILISIWLVVAGFGAPYFGRVDEVSDIDLIAFLPESAEATKVNNEVKKFQSDATVPMIIVFTDIDDVLDDDDVAKIDSATQSLNEIEAVVGEVSPPQLSDDKQASFVIAGIAEDEKIAEIVKQASEKLDQELTGSISYKITGPAGFSADLMKAFSGIDGILLITALSVVFVILVIVYRSILLPLIVLLTSIFALSASVLIVWNLASTGVLKLNGQSQGILFILVIGAATDYSLLYISRYREELYRIKSAWQATYKALKGSFEPILASGSTVIVGLLCLLLSDLTSNKDLGPIGSVGIAMAMLSALTFLPTVLSVLGRASFWPNQPIADASSRKVHQQKLRTGIWPRIGRFVSAQPRRIWVGVTVLLVVLATGLFGLQAEGVEQSKLIIGQANARDGQEILNQHFPDGSGSPALVITQEASYQKVVETLEQDSGVDSVSVMANDSPSGVLPLGRSAEKIKQKIRQEVEQSYDEQNQKLFQQEAELAEQYGPLMASAIMADIRSRIPSIESVANQAYPFAQASPKVIDGEVLLQVTLSDAPDSQPAKDTIIRLRDQLKQATDGQTLVGGTTAVQLDTITASIRDRKVIIPVVLVAITIILMVLLRSILAPVLLLLTTVVSFGTALGVASVLFNHVWHFPGADPSVVLYSFVFLVALGIDYNIFLMTRVREEAVRVGTDKGVIKGLVVTGGVITSAGVVLAATFTALAVIPILFLTQLAFIVAFGVLLDTIIVRSLLVPALIKDIGSIVWWPSKLTSKK